MYLLLLIICPLVLKGQMLSVYPGAYLTVTSSTNLSLSGTMGLTVKSTSSGTGSFLNLGTLSVGGSSKVERYLTKNAWHMITPSTTGVTANDFYWNDDPKCWLMYHSESSNSWSYNTPLNTAMSVGQGWMVWLDNSYSGEGATATMTGTFRNTDLSPSINFTDASHGYNALGNPFPCAIDFHTGSWTMTNLEQTIWIWNNSSDNYLYRTSAGGGTMSNGIIPVGQGFFVHATATSPTLTIPLGSRVHNSQGFYKVAQTSTDYEYYIRLLAKKGNSADEVWVSFGQNGSENFDNGFDASKLFGGQDAPQLYLKEIGNNLSIDHLPLLGQSDRIVSMLFIPGEDGEQLIEANTDHFKQNGVILEDLKTGQKQDLVQNRTYSFTAGKADSHDRFRLHFKNSLGIQNSDVKESLVAVYSSGDDIYIKSCGDALTQNGILIVFDMLGKQVFQHNLDRVPLQKVRFDRNNGFYLVRAIKPSGISTKKIYIH
jgi:hypothetical protein